METIEQCVKSVQGYINKYTRKTELTRYFRVFIVDFKQVNADCNRHLVAANQKVVLVLTRATQKLYIWDKVFKNGPSKICG